MCIIFLTKYTYGQIGQDLRDPGYAHSIEMSIAEYAEKGCEVCREFMDAKYEGPDQVLNSRQMIEDALRIQEHLRDEHKEVKRKQYAFTFTTNKSKEEIEKEMIHSAHKLFLQKTVPIRQGEAYLEYTEEGRPHIHGWYETEDGGRVFAKVFARCWPAWKEKRGQTQFAGGYHEVMKSGRYKGYSSAEDRVICMKKENEELIIDAPSEVLS